MFSAFLARADREVVLKVVPTSKRGPRLNHLFFIEDSLLFCKADLCHLDRLTSILTSYENASRQKLITSKTTIFF